VVLAAALGVALEAPAAMPGIAREALVETLGVALKA
jgi:hypothetical protein